MHRVVQLAAQLLRGEPDRAEQVGPTDVADEQGVAGEDRVRRAVGGVLEHQVGDGLGRVARCGPGLDHDVTELDPLAVGEVVDGELGLGGLTEADLGAGGLGQLEVAGHVVGMEVGEQHVGDRQPVGVGVGEVLADVALGIHHDGLAGALIAHQVGRERQARELVLLEDHRVVPPADTGVVTTDCTYILQVRGSTDQGRRTLVRPSVEVPYPPVDGGCGGDGVRGGVGPGRVARARVARRSRCRPPRRRASPAASGCCIAS